MAFLEFPRKQAGLSLVELMVALVLGALLTVGIVQIFTSNSQSFRINTSEARVQETGRIAIDMMARAIRNAGYFGCFPVNPIANNLDSTDDDYSPGLHEFNYDGLVSDNGSRPGNALANTDHLRLSGVRGGSGVVATADVTSTVFTVDRQGGLGEGDIVMISDCENGDIFELESIEDNGTNFTITAVQQNNADDRPGNDFSLNAPAGCPVGDDCFASVYPQGVRIKQPYTETYYVGTGASGAPALFVDGGGPDVEIAENVVDLDFLYGESATPGGPVQNWRDANAVGDWGNVGAVQTSILIRSEEDNVLTDAMQYCFPGWLDCTSAGNLTTANDRRLYRVYTLTTAIRNRVDS